MAFLFPYILDHSKNIALKGFTMNTKNERSHEDRHDA